MTLGEQIKALRKAQGLTRDELAARIGVTGAYISMLESGKRTDPSRDVLRGLATVLGVSVAELEGEPDILSGDFPAGQLNREGITAVLGEDKLLRYARLWGDLPRDQRAWLIGHLRIIADAERRLRQWEAAASDDEPDGAAFPAGTNGPAILPSVVL